HQQLQLRQQLIGGSTARLQHVIAASTPQQAGQQLSGRGKLLPDSWLHCNWCQRLKKILYVPVLLLQPLVEPFARSPFCQLCIKLQQVCQIACEGNPLQHGLQAAQSILLCLCLPDLLQRSANQVTIGYQQRNHKKKTDQAELCRKAQPVHQ